MWDGVGKRIDDLCRRRYLWKDKQEADNVLSWSVLEDSPPWPADGVGTTLYEFKLFKNYLNVNIK